MGCFCFYCWSSAVFSRARFFYFSAQNGQTLTADSPEIIKIEVGCMTRPGSGRGRVYRGQGSSQRSQPGPVTGSLGSGPSGGRGGLMITGPGGGAVAGIRTYTNQA